MISDIFSNKNRNIKIVLLLSIFLSVLSFFWSYINDYVVAYNDSMSHLNIARLVIDNIEPSFAQLGSVWLPLNHVLSLCLVWNNWAWHSGFAGSIFSMLAYVISSVFLFKTIRLITENEVASLIGTLAFLLNVNILYLQSTPLTEPLFVSLFIISIYCFAKWIYENNPKHLIFLGVIGFFEILIRYDGWFVTAVAAILLVIHQLFVCKKKINDVVGVLLVYSAPIIFAAILWLLWNYFIFNDFLYFAFGQYSAKSQQNNIAANSGLITKGSWYLSVLTYTYDVISNVGIFALVASVIGIVSHHIFKKSSISVISKILILILLISPILFNALSLYLGFSIISIPELYLKKSGEFSEQWFNVRYGIMALPLVAVGIGLLSSFKKITTFAAIIVIIFQFMFMSYHEGAIDLIDGVAGSSSFANQDIASELRKRVSVDDKIILSTSFFNAVTFKSGFNLKEFIHEGVSKRWQNALNYPEDYAKWVVMSNGDVGEPVYESLVKKNNNNFLYFYKLEYKGKHANIYKLKDDNELSIKKEGTKLKKGKEEFYVKGVNSYDLAFRSDDEIKSNFEYLKKAGVNSIRFWLFGDGMEDGFQPEAGIMNEERFKKADLIFALGREYDIKLIPVLLNNWDDYGGKAQYLRWTGKYDLNEKDIFYNNEDNINLFKNYIDHVLTRTNTITGKEYREEPSILAWEIMNEPRCEKCKENTLNMWVENIASHVKKVDNNHLVTIGDEMRDREDNFNTCSIDKIDFCSFHLYLYYEDVPLFENIDEVNNLISFQAEISENVKKPIIIGEFGIPKKLYPFDSEPLEVMKNIKSFAFSHNYSGILIWNWALLSDNSFGFSKDGDGESRYNINDLLEIIK